MMGKERYLCGKHEGECEADAGQHDAQRHVAVDDEPASKREEDDEAEVDGAAVRRLQPRLGVRKLHPCQVGHACVTREPLALQVLTCMHAGSHLYACSAHAARLLQCARAPALRTLARTFLVTLRPGLTPQRPAASAQQPHSL
jgi:hypothetical protein